MVGPFTGEVSGWLLGGELALCLLRLLSSSRETGLRAQSRLGGWQDVGVGSPQGAVIHPVPEDSGVWLGRDRASRALPRTR